MQSLAERLLQTIQKGRSFVPGDRVAAAVSGGADSVALLCLLLAVRGELGIVLTVAHVNHKLRSDESDQDERFVAELAQRYGLELHTYEAPIVRGSHGGSGSAKGSGIEAAAREQRYDFFRRLTREGHVTKIATAHTLDDQAETVLMRIFRGTGIRGLSGIHPRIAFEEEGRVFGEVVRPLLDFRRLALREFLREVGQSWREDSSNLDVGFLRNRVRRRLLPVIAEEFGEAAIEHMGELAEIARAEEEQWAVNTEHPAPGTQAAGTPALPKSFGARPPDHRLDLQLLLALPLAAQRRLVRGWLEANASHLSLSFRLVEDVLALTRGAAGTHMELPSGGNSLRQHLHRGASELWLKPGRGQGASDYEYPLIIPGMVEVRELGTCIEARIVETRGIPDDQQGQLLDLSRMPKEVLIRNWRAGDRFWPAYTAGAKKVKELLSERRATGAEKKLWPVAVAADCGLLWIRGFAVPAAFRPRATDSKAIWIREIAGMM